MAALTEHVRLPGSQDHNNVMRTCDRCKQERFTNDGVSAGTRYVCGVCWRKFGFRDPARKFGVKK